MNYTIETIDTGDLYSDVVENVVFLLDKHKRELNIKEIYGTDLSYLPVTPSAIVTWDDAEEETRTLSGTRAEMTVTSYVDIIYYHQEITNDERKKEIVSKLHEISSMFRTHRTLNGYCTSLRSEIISVEYLPRVRDNGIMGAGTIKLKAPKMIRVESPE